MVTVDLTKAGEFLSDKDFNKARDKAEESFRLVQTKGGAGSEMLGWRDMLADPNDAVLERIDAEASEIRANADVFVVCGIGGSHLGFRAVIEALTPFFGSDDGPEIRYAGLHMSGRYLDDLIDYLEQPAEDGGPKSVYLNVISKSGTTLETALSFRVLADWMRERFEDYSDRIICTTSREGGVLNRMVDAYGYGKFVIPDDVGGRFSVLTPVGLLPIAVAGIDVRTLFYEAVSKYEAVEQDPSAPIDYAALRYGLYSAGRKIDVIASFHPELNYLGRWMQQLLAESEAKEGKGLFTAVANFTSDLHSLGQLLQQGERNILETFLIVKQPPKGIRLEKSENNVDQLDYLAGKSFEDINSKALEGTLEAHSQGGVPCIKLMMDKLNAQHLGEFIYFAEISTAIYCYCLDINPFNQPGVEDYKQAMYKLLGK